MEATAALNGLGRSSPTNHIQVNKRMAVDDFELDTQFLPGPSLNPTAEASVPSVVPSLVSDLSSSTPSSPRVATDHEQLSAFMKRVNEEPVGSAKRPRLDLDLELDQDFADLSQSRSSPLRSSRHVGAMQLGEERGYMMDGEAEVASHTEELSAKGLTQEMEEELPPLSQVLPPLRPEFSVSNLDLGDGYTRAATVSGLSFDGKQMSFKRKPVKTLAQIEYAKTQAQSNFSRRATQLLEKPIHQLLEEIEKMKSDPPIAEPEPLTEVNLARVDQKGKGKRKESEMWTDVYRPKKFTDLLGDDRMNRAAMSWLKEWDTCVFKSADAKNARKKAMAAERRKKARAESSKNGMADEVMNAEDHLGRPVEKILLLSGPPGLGKTTLAHVLAKQAGYQVHEINASDDRSAKVVTDRIRDALESRALTSVGSISDNRPTCVVIDEIDGATGGGDSGFVRTLIKFVMDGSKAPRKSAIKAFNKPNKKKDVPLIRPIICICNDLYAPALRQLRPIARIVRFNSPAQGSLIARLRTICAAEHLIADTKSLTALASSAEGDMRNCLNTLQFIKSKSSVVDEATVRAATVGSKDTGTSSSAVWDRLFKIPVNRKGKSEESEKYVSWVIRDVSTCGEYDRLIQGCFEHYLLCKSPTDGWKSIEKALDWVAFYDKLDLNLKSERNYDLMPYIPYSFVHWRALFANVANKSVEWPKTDYEAYLKRSAHEEIAETFAKKVPMGTRTSFTGSSLIGELAPFLTRILSPDIKLISGQTAKPDDKILLDKIAATMNYFGLTFVHDRTDEGQLTYKFEPPIDVFVHYDGKRASDIPASRYALRHIIAQQMDFNVKTAQDGVDAPTAQSIYSAYKQSNAANQTTASVTKPVDFFGRELSSKASLRNQVIEDMKTSDLPPRKKVKVTYKYNEGSSNAVRLPIKLAELFR